MTFHFPLPRVRGGKARTALRIFTAVLALAPALPAATYYGTTTTGPLAFDSGNIYAMITDGNNPNLGWVNGTAGIEFSLPAGTYTLDSFTLPLRSLIGSVQATFTLYSGNTRPETALTSVTQNLPFSTSFSLDTFNIPGGITLSGLQNYFLIGSVPQSTTNSSQVDWAGSSPATPTPLFYGQTWLTGTYSGYGFLGWNNYTPGAGPAWQITVASANAPEPGLMLLMGAGLVVVGLLRFRRS